MSTIFQILLGVGGKAANFSGLARNATTIGKKNDIATIQYIESERKLVVA